MNASERERMIFAEQLREAGLSTERFIDVHDGEKKSTNHTRLTPENVSGNYGVYAGRGGDESAPYLVDVDIDDYASKSTGGDTAAIEAVRELPDTLSVESPHTDGESGGHRFYAVTGDVTGTIESICDATNPTLSWGEIRVRNQYVVGPGSQLDGCGKEWCDECEKPDGGWYRIAVDRPIAMIDAADLADVIRADPAYPKTESPGTGDANPGVEGPDPGEQSYEPEPDGTRPQSVVRRTPWIGDRLENGPDDDDYSDSDYSILVEFVENGVSESDARDFMGNEPETKVHRREKGNKSLEDYWNRTWKAALKQAAKNRAENDRDPLAGIDDAKEYAENAVDEAVETINPRRGPEPSMGERTDAVETAAKAIAEATEAGLSELRREAAIDALVDNSGMKISKIKTEVERHTEEIQAERGTESEHVPFDHVLRDRLKGVTIIKNTDANQRTMFRWHFDGGKSEDFVVETKLTKDGLEHHNWNRFLSKYASEAVDEVAPDAPSTKELRSNQNRSWINFVERLRKDRQNGDPKTVIGPRSEAVSELLDEISRATGFYGPNAPLGGHRMGVLVDGHPDDPDLPDPTRVFMSNDSAKALARHGDITERAIQAQVVDEGLSPSDMTGVSDRIWRDGQQHTVWFFDFDALAERGCEPIVYAEDPDAAESIPFDVREIKAKQKRNPDAGLTDSEKKRLDEWEQEREKSRPDDSGTGDGELFDELAIQRIKGNADDVTRMENDSDLMEKSKAGNDDESGSSRREKFTTSDGDSED